MTKYTIGIHTRVGDERSESRRAGNSHAWISISDEDGRTNTYGLFPDNQTVRDAGQEAGWNDSNNSQVRKNIELNVGDQPTTNLYFEGGEEINDRFQSQLQASSMDNPRACWSRENVNCSTWAADTWAHVTGEHLETMHSDRNGLGRGNTPIGLENSIRNRQSFDENQRLETRENSPQPLSPADREVLMGDESSSENNATSSMPSNDSAYHPHQPSAPSQEPEQSSEASPISQGNQGLKAKLDKIGSPLPPPPPEEEGEAQERNEGRSR